MEKSAASGLPLVEHGKSRSFAGDNYVMSYIPLRLVDLKLQIVKDHADLFTGTNEAKMTELFSAISTRNHARMYFEYNQWQEDYAFVDPDVDTKLPIPISKFPTPTQHQMYEAWFKIFEYVLKEAEFEPLTDAQLAIAKQESSLDGLDVKHVNQDVVQTKLWYREMVDYEKNVRNMRTFFCNRLVRSQKYSRVVMLFRIMRTEEEISDMRRRANCIRRCFGLGRNYRISSQKVFPGMAYLKYFREIDVKDIDMMMPGTSVKFSWFDWIMIWGPILFGVGAAIYKAINQTLSFDSWSDALTSVLLVVMPLTWGVKAYLTIKDKANRYEMHINTLFMLHNLNNNAGVVSQILDEALEQENKEAALAYFFLWRATLQGRSMTLEELDRETTAYLTTVVNEMGVKAHIDFNVHDGVEDLHTFGVIKDLPGGKMQVVPIDEAIKLSDVSGLKDTERKAHRLEDHMSEALPLSRGATPVGSGPTIREDDVAVDIKDHDHDD